MRRWPYLNIWVICFCFTIIASVSAQQAAPVSYYCEGEEIVFQFDSRVYEQATRAGTDQKLDFADLDIYKVALSGNFNGWSKRGWAMKKVGPYTYQLRKKIKSFNENFTLEYKFIINGKYWAEPDERFENKVFADDFWEDVYNLSVYDLEPNPDGNVTFYLSGNQNANQVILSGSFNGWNEKYLKMDKRSNGWELSLQLPPDRYEYKFIVDGEWMHDPENPEKVINQYATFNSVLYVNKKVSFLLKGYQNASKVILAGSFNDWNEKAIQLNKTESGWTYSLDLVGGKHFYKFIVDGKWIVDPENPYQEYDNKGHLNSVLIVQ